jgi:8-oxo-dGTP pyrophosphatase MutT (NUDIX family)
MSKTITAGIFFINKDNKLLICHPTNHKKSFFSIPKGKVEENETLLEAALRETSEESNVDFSVCKVIHKLNPVPYKLKNKELNPFCILENENDMINSDDFELKCNSFVKSSSGKNAFLEMDGYQYVTLDEAKKLLHETQVSCLEYIKNNFLDKI